MKKVLTHFLWRDKLLLVAAEESCSGQEKLLKKVIDFLITKCYYLKVADNDKQVL